MYVTELVLLSMFCTFVGISGAGTKFAGPFDYSLREIVECDDKGNGSIIFANKKLRKISRTSYVVSVDITTGVSFTDEDLGVTARLSVWGNGGWRPNFMILHFKEVCKSMAAKTPDIFKQLLEAVNQTSCPIPPGQYKIVDASALSTIEFPSLPYNKYKVCFEFTNNDGVLLGCVGVITDVIPKEKKKG